MQYDQVFEAVYETILSRDTRHDGVYYVGIVTTGIFCRPSCRSRTPKRDNVRVYSSIEEARHAGFRACKRCKPDDPTPHGPDAELAEALSELIRQRYRENGLTLEAMAAALAISPYHMQRVYKRVTGLTPSKRLQQVRIEAAKRCLHETDRPIADIAKANGFGTAAHFSFVFQRSEGCAPNEYRNRITKKENTDEE
ncbi:Ada metal-binding domain-containing protein [Paenibacillus sp. GD4]|uniref:bifunctional transcriptional activator/DNA repair enzyme AdaA n=1 Tax=Paenibacillus sp. GD4 TaxID=3068890 RepID=UPI002796BF65|nr:Ada metal-binding domain-containing protein [Paenibacillus sp. GD4]MDQ1910101.1 Ada metal-binding domain-containing protein [Paenibacillus sp. GD4]